MELCSAKRAIPTVVFIFETVPVSLQKNIFRTYNLQKAKKLFYLVVNSYYKSKFTTNFCCVKLKC